MKNSVKIVHLYPKEMNIYGDTGNRLVLQKRLERRGYMVEIELVGIGQKIPNDCDIIIAGGGQDSGQSKVMKDLLSKGGQIRLLTENGVCMLLVCGMYQLFGHYFKTQQGEVIEGIGVLDIKTYAGDKRIIGNIKVDSDFGTLIGYENHSGKTYLGPDCKPLGYTAKNQGNNGEDRSEGAVYKNVFATYLHGPILPKNPELADEIIKRAVNRKYGHTRLKTLDDEMADLAAQRAMKRPR